MHVLQENGNTLAELGGHRLEHLLESVPEGGGAVQDRVVDLQPVGEPHAEVVGEVVIGVLEGDGPVPVSENDSRRSHGGKSDCFK